METIEQSIVKGLLYDEEYARKTFPYLKPDFFDGATRELFNIYSEFFEKYHKIPTMEAMIVAVQNSKMDEGSYDNSIEALQSAYQGKDDLADTEWLVDETEKYCVDRALFNAIYKSMSIIEGSSDLDKHSIPEILDEALSISFDTSIGSDYLEDFMKRYEYYTSEESRLPFPLKAFNIMTNGGLPPKTLTALLASTNVGKSALMCFFAGEWLKVGKNVLYISMEMSEEAVQERIDANLLDMSTSELKNPDLDKDLFVSKVKKLKERTTGSLIVKEYPTSGAHVGHFRHLLKELRQKKKFKPDIIFVDYINICLSSRFKSGSNANSYTIVKSIAEELRGLAVEFEVPVFTATQVNRDNMNAQSLDMTATSESVGLPQTLDAFIGVVTNEELMEMGRQVVMLLKTRFGNKSNVKAQTIKVDFDRMRYSDVETDSYEEVKNSVSHSPGIIEKQNRLKSGIPNDITWD